MFSAWGLLLVSAKAKRTFLGQRSIAPRVLLVDRSSSDRWRTAIGTPGRASTESP
jgi:hypothetical protein